MKMLLAAVLLSHSLLISAQTADTTRISGRVVSPLGGTIANAAVAIHWNMPRAVGPTQPQKTDLILATDGSGRFSASLVPGFYDICVHSPGSSAACETVEVGSGGEETYDTKLKPNPQIANEYGDILREGVFSIIPTEVPPLPNSIPTLEVRAEQRAAILR